MNITYTRPGELRKPDIEVLPDGRIRIVRYVAAGHGSRDQGEIDESIGSPDDGLSTALLVKRAMGLDQGKVAIIKTYEVRNASSETQVGLPDISFGDNGLKTIIQDFVQMSSGAYVPGTIGSTQSPTDATCILQQEQAEDDGTTRQIRRVYINKGLINQSDEIKNNGALLIKTLVFINDVPSPNPPTGYTLVSTQITSPNGLETTTFTFALGTGEISREDSTSNNGALLRATIRNLSTPSVTVNPITTPSGYTLINESYQDQDGHKIWSASYANGNGEISRNDEVKNNGALEIATIRHLTSPSVSSNPISTPSGYTLVSLEYSDQDGHKLWTASYAKGTGQISQDDESKNNGALLLRTIKNLVAPAAANPIATPSGYTLILETFAEQDGYRIWTSIFAKGDGEISRDDNTKNNGALLIATIRHLTAPSVTSNPITTPSGYTLISVAYSDQDGHKLWNASYAKGNGEIDQDDTTSNNGALLLRSIRHLVAPSAANPIATPAGYTLVKESKSEQDGHRVWSASYAKGDGKISQDDTTSNNGALLRRTIRHLVAPSAANPIATPSGYTLVAESFADQDGHRIWTASYANGSGTISTNDDTRQGGKLLIRTIRSLGTAPSTPGGYTLISADSQTQDGYTLFNSVFAKGVGRISTETQTKNGGALVLTSIRFLGSDDGSTPTGTLVSTETTQQDGYALTNAQYALGSGVLSTSDSTRNNGALLIRTIRSLGTAPSTPSGYISISEESATQDGYVLYNYSYAKGNGEISRAVDFQQSNDQGTTGITRTTIRYLVAPGGSIQPSTLAGSVLVGQEVSEQDGHRIWLTNWAKGTGLVSSAIESRFQSKLIITRRIALGAAPSAPSSIISGTVNTVSTSMRESDGVEIYESSFVEALGVVEKNIQPRDGGLRVESWVSFGSSYDAGFMQPPGILLFKDEDQADGYVRFTATCMQSASGGDPTSGNAVSLVTKRPFTFPGRAKAFTSSFSAVGYTAFAHNVYLSPPIELLVDATVQISYQTSTTITLPYSLWNPDSWATVRAFWEGWNQNAQSLVQSYNGYRAVGSAVTFTASSGFAGGFTDNCMGSKVYGGSSGSITVDGGPSAPDGNTFTLAASLDAAPAFCGSNGVKYFRQTIVYATIPSQPALPV